MWLSWITVEHNFVDVVPWNVQNTSRMPQIQTESINFYIFGGSIPPDPPSMSMFMHVLYIKNFIKVSPSTNIKILYETKQIILTGKIFWLWYIEQM